MKMRQILPAFICLISSWSIAGMAAQQEPAAQSFAAANTGTAALQTLLGLILVLAVIVLLAWLLRHHHRFTGSHHGTLKILATLPLGTRERAVLLQVGQQQLLLGVTQQHISTLLVLDAPLPESQPDSTTTDFTDKLKQLLQQQGRSS